MKFQSIVLGISCAGSALAAVHTEMNDDGSIKSVFFDNNSLEKRDCTANNCLRALRGRPESATSFCRTYTTAVVTTVAPFTQCGSPGKASSACSCYVPAPTPPPCGPPGAHCTIEDFIQACCQNPDGSVGCYFPTGDPENGVCFLP